MLKNSNIPHNYNFCSLVSAFEGGGKPYNGLQGDSAFIAGKGMQRSKVQGTCGYVKGVPFVNRRYVKGVQEWYIKG